MSQFEAEDEQQRPRAVFEREMRGETEWLLPTFLAGGPWNPEHQHGAAICAALTRAIERCPTPVPMRVQRISFELMRAVPIKALRTEVQVIRSGGRTQLAQASLFDGESELARATALWIRTTKGLGLESQPNALRRTPLDLAPGAGAPPVVRVEHLPGYIQGIDFRRADGEPDGTRPATIWVRQKTPLFAGEEMTPLLRLGSAADFVSGPANALDFGRYVSINPDVTLHILRYPESEWLAARGTTEIDPAGVGQSQATIYDEFGPVARAMASLFIDARPEAP